MTWSQADKQEIVYFLLGTPWEMQADTRGHPGGSCLQITYAVVSVSFLLLSHYHVIVHIVKHVTGLYVRFYVVTEPVFDT